MAAGYECHQRPHGYRHESRRSQGKATTPITYDSNCLEEVCGSCAMRISGKAAMACSSLVHKLERPIRSEPLSRFPVIRDLTVDRGVLFDNLKRVKAWVPIDLKPFPFKIRKLEG